MGNLAIFCIMRSNAELSNMPVATQNLNTEFVTPVITMVHVIVK